MGGGRTGDAGGNGAGELPLGPSGETGGEGGGEIAGECPHEWGGEGDAGGEKRGEPGRRSRIEVKLALAPVSG